MAVLLSVITLSPAYGATRAYNSEWLKKDVRDSELVIRGIISDLRTETMPYDLLYPRSSGRESPLSTGEKPAPPSIREFPVTVIEVQVGSTLKGSWDRPAIRVALPGDPKSGGFNSHTTYNYEVDEEVILCLHFDPSIVGDGFRIYGDSGSFVKRGDTWLTRDGNGVVSVEDIKALSKAVEPSRMYMDSDAVVVGTIEAVDTREFDCGFEISCLADYVALRVTQSWKGASTDETLLVRALRRGTNLPWFAAVPTLAVGDSYIMFLKKDEVGFYPFVGFNGLLKIQGEKLIMNGSVEYPLSKSRMIAAVEQEVDLD